MTSQKALPAITRFLCLLPFLALPAMALERKDVVGFWSLEIQDDVFGMLAEIHFADNGSFEGRMHVERLGETTLTHGRGTWSIKGDFLITDGNGPCAELEGDQVLPCALEPGETTLDTFKVDGIGAARQLVLISEFGDEPFGEYQGSARNFTLPALLAPTPIARGTAPRQGSAASARLRKGALNRGIDIFDLRGRSLGTVPRIR